ncbi:sigma-70 family RNA polymerase sigma factor [Streptomyces sp. NBC_01422]|uniref:sigma-70 family RNA polymerase sigma factor n=1 Tax=Streptomyces sp. NBC_01422 TaxID=2903859 RepID=UPI002E2E7C69|nr:sigma-70 family RNA polymerase sigma factor [Streptomyces sp. NBC_01422]
MLDHRSALLTCAEKLLRDRHTAEDIVQETLIRAWRHADRLMITEGAVRRWLLTVTRNLAIDRMRSASFRHEEVGTEGQEMVQPDHADHVLTALEATALLHHLSPEHRQVLQYIYLSEKTVGETAQILGIPTGTVKSRQHYALNRLRARLSYSDQA